jgi:hypothetical protein
MIVLRIALLPLVMQRINSPLARPRRASRALVLPQGLDDMPGVVMMLVLGAGETIIGLTPPLSISVAPSGMLPRPPAEAPDDPVVSRPVVFVATPAVPQPPVDPVVAPLMPLALMPAVPPLMPPPSNVPVAVDSPLTVEQPEPTSGPGDGLRPPTLSWVTPSGMLGEAAGALELMPSVPSGDVAPSAELVTPPGMVVTCASAALLPSISAMIEIPMSRMKASMSCTSLSSQFSVFGRRRCLISVLYSRDERGGPAAPVNSR